MAGRNGPMCQCGQCRRYKQLRQDFRARCKTKRAPCWLCQQAIDYGLSYEDPDSWSLDHRLPRSTHPELTEVPSNFEASHLSCNKNRGNREPMNLGSTTRAW